MTYDEWENAQEQPMSPTSPESYEAEKAWNAAVAQAIDIVGAATQAEDPLDAGRIVAFVLSELEAMQS